MEYYIYILSNKDWLYENKYKYGYTTNPINRLNNSHEQHSYKSKYIKLYQFNIINQFFINKPLDIIFSIISRNNQFINSYQNKYNCSLYLLKQLNQFLINHNGSTEFIHFNGLQLIDLIIKNEFKYFGIELIKEFTQNELDDINNSIINNSYQKYYNEINLDINNDIFIRPYQKYIIDKSIDELKINNKIYIELATGGGKSFCVYNLFKIIDSKNILIFSPRININLQNVNYKYIKLLNNNYNIYNYSSNDIFIKYDYNIIIACIQSYKKIYHLIKNNNIENIDIWFDESHHTIENWIYNKNKFNDFFLNDNIHFNNKIFTSASPNKDIIIKNKLIFGNLINVISIKELIKQKWLSNIQLYISEFKDDNDINIIKYVIKSFNELGKNYGFSFHNYQDNAYNLFKHHYILYIENKTNIKPFLLISKSYNDIRLNYDYTNINTFENNINSIAYVVQKYTMGYDFKKLDYIIFTDPKTSYSDIIQSIGRGTRSDGLGLNGTNLNKILSIILPSFINDEEDKYQRIINVMKYLLKEFPIEYNDIKFNNNKKNNSKDSYISNTYEGKQLLETILYDIINDKLLWTYKQFITHLQNNDIHNIKDYHNYTQNNKHLNLPKYPYDEFQEFIWIDTYQNKELFYNKQQCIQNIKSLLENIDMEYFELLDQEKIEYLHNIDNKIPNNNLWRFYGGNKDDFNY